MRRVLLAILLGLLTLIDLPVAAHTDRELEEWLAEWRFRSATTGVDLRPALEDMRGRHPCRKLIDTWSEDCEVPVSPPPVAAQAAPDAPDRGMGAGVEQWRGLVAAYFPADQVDRALCIMGYESGGNPSARNPSSSATGLMQVLFSTWGPRFGLDSRSDLEDPNVNLSIAAALYADGGWGHWSPYNRGLCH